MGELQTLAKEIKQLKILITKIYEEITKLDNKISWHIDDLETAHKP